MASATNTTEKKSDKKETKPWLVVPQVPKGQTYEQMVEGEKRNPYTEKKRKATNNKARAEIRKGAKRVKLMVNGETLDLKVTTRVEDTVLLTAANGDTFGVELNAAV